MAKVAVEEEEENEKQEKRKKSEFGNIAIRDSRANTYVIQLYVP